VSKHFVEGGGGFPWTYLGLRYVCFSHVYSKAGKGAEIAVGQQERKERQSPLLTGAPFVGRSAEGLNDKTMFYFPSPEDRVPHGQGVKSGK